MIAGSVDNVNPAVFVAVAVLSGVVGGFGRLLRRLKCCSEEKDDRGDATLRSELSDVLENSRRSRSIGPKRPPAWLAALFADRKLWVEGNSRRPC